MFPLPDLNSNRKQQINELPQEIKYSLIFDEEIDGPYVKEVFDSYNKSLLDQNLNEGSMRKTQKEEIESDEEEDLMEEEMGEEDDY